MSFEALVSISNHTSKRMEKFNWGLRNSQLESSAVTEGGGGEKKPAGIEFARSQRTASKIARGKNFPVKAPASKIARASIAALITNTLFNCFTEQQRLAKVLTSI